MIDMNATTCRKCNGTGFLAWTAVDHGRCWSCTGRADTSYTVAIEAAARITTDAERSARWAAHCAEISAARRARRGR